MILTDPKIVAKIAGSTQERAEFYFPFLQGTCKAYGITSIPRIVGFLSQIGHESRGMSVIEENLNYSVEGLQVFVRWGRISAADARRYGRASGQKANQEAIANIIYGGRFGRENLGNTEPGDGWKFRGRGLKQLTGRDNYKRCGAALGEAFTVWPERVLMPVNAALSAGWFWDSKKLNKIADAGDVRKMTLLVNGGLTGLKERQALWDDGLAVFA